MISIKKFYFLTNVHLKVIDLLILGTLVIGHELILTGWKKQIIKPLGKSMFGVALLEMKS